jgi:hypothetical protein
MAGFCSAEVFINWNAEYYVEHPDDWQLVPYSTVNIFLRTQEVNPRDFAYDGVLAPESDKPFFEHPYIFMLTDKVGALSEKEIDSVLNVVAIEFKNGIKRVAIESGTVKLGLNEPIYDKDKGYIVTKSRVSSEYIDKYMLEFRRFYEHGVAYFLCYAPKEVYNDVQPTFFEIVQSLSTENLADLAPKDSMVVVDVSGRELEKYDETEFETDSGNSSSSGNLVLIIGIIVLVLIIGIVVVAKLMKG